MLLFFLILFENCLNLKLRNSKLRNSRSVCIAHVGGVCITRVGNLYCACEECLLASWRVSIFRNSRVRVYCASRECLLRKSSECLYCVSRSVYCASLGSVCIAQVEFACILRKLSFLYCASLECIYIVQVSSVDIHTYICSASREYIYCACCGSVVVYVKSN
jgi:hypothetical protein